MPSRPAANKPEPTDPAESIIEITRKLEETATFLREVCGQQSWNIPSMRECMIDVVSEIELAMLSPGEPHGIRTGFKDWDALSGGFHPGRLVVLASRPCMGKTTLAMNLTRFISGNGKIPTAIFCSQMSRNTLVQRFISSDARVSLTDLRAGYLSAKRHFPKLMKAASGLADLPLWIDDTPNLSIDDLKFRVRQLKREHDIGFVWIDELQSIRSRSPLAQESRQNEVAEVTAGLKDLASEMQIPVFTTAHLNQQEEQQQGFRPLLSDLADSGEIGLVADQVALLSPQQYYVEPEEMKSRVNLILAKNIHGPTGEVPLTFCMESFRFEDCAPETTEL